MSSRLKRFLASTCVVASFALAPFVAQAENYGGTLRIGTFQSPRHLNSAVQSGLDRVVIQINQDQTTLFMGQQLRKIGINAELRISADFPSWAQRVASHNFDVTTDNVWNWGDAFAPG